MNTTKEEIRKAINALRDMAIPEYSSLYKPVNMAVEALAEQINHNNELKMGHWTVDRDDNRTWDRVRFVCSVCGEWQTYGKTKYCPECGAKMQEVKE